MTKRIAILCSGLSVRDQDLSKINVPIIGVNWSVQGRQPTIHVISNRVLIKKYENNIEDLSTCPMRFSGTELNGAYTPRRIMNYANIHHYSAGLAIPPLPSGYDIYKHGWVFAGGGPCALQVAISIASINEIVFVGLDLEHDKDMHFYSHENGAKRSEYSGYTRKQLENAWTVQRAYFEQTRDQFITEMGLRIINTGLSDVFERVPFEEMFP